MALNDTAVLTAAVGYVYVATNGTASPTPAQLLTIDPANYGGQVQNLKITGTPTGGTFTLTSGTATTALPYNATTTQVQAALEALASVGIGQVSVTGTSISDANGFNIVWTGTKSGATANITSTPTLTGGTTPLAPVTQVSAATGWNSIGHTSRGDLPEFGYEGGDHEVKGTWQNEALREIVTKPIQDSVSLKLHQFDQSTFELYFGTDSSSTAGVFGVANGNVAPVEKAFLVLVVDGANRVGFYSPRASVRRDKSIDMKVDDLAALPVKATFLKYGSANKFEWINANFA
jgi:hypothetical protein